MLKVGIIGTGIIAREHATAIAMLSARTALVAAADIAADRLEDFCSAFQVPREYLDPLQLIADPEVDVVVITTPPAAHEALAIAALEGGKYVFCEKPLAQSLASAARLAEAEARHPGRLATSYQLRYEPAFLRLLWLCQNGWIGDLQSARIERHSYIPHSGAGRTGWWGTWAVAGGGVLMTQLIHELDILLLVMGRPLSVSAEMDTRNTGIESEDWIEATIRFENRSTARCIASVNSGRSGGGIEIKGSLGAITPSGITMNDPARSDQALKAVNAALPHTRPESMSLPSRAIRKMGRRLGVKEIPALTAHARLYQDIEQCIRRGAPLPIPPAEAMKSLQVCAAIYESALTGRTVDLPLDSTSSAYCGISKERYDARPRPQYAAPRRATALEPSTTVRIGMIGLDTSHAPTFSNLLHNPDDPLHIPGGKVVAAYPGGSSDMFISASRVGGFTNELRDKYGVRMLDSPEQVADECDLVLILSSDGRAHRGLFRAVAGRGKPVFVDKPFAPSADDARDIFDVAAQTGTRIFTSSAFRYADGLVGALNSIRASGEKVESCRIRYWLQLQPTQGRYFWYGIHASEMLLAIMGEGVREVTVSNEGDNDTIAVRHDDGRRSWLVGAQNDGTFHVSIQTDQRTLDVDLGPSMPSLGARMLASVLDVLSDGAYPRLWRASASGTVADRPGRALDPGVGETMEVIRVLDAAQLSYASGHSAAI